LCKYDDWGRREWPIVGNDHYIDHSVGVVKFKKKMGRPYLPQLKKKSVDPERMISVKVDRLLQKKIKHENFVFLIERMGEPG
jgi:hypothetical protein